jgi:hypothetical protein
MYSFAPTHTERLTPSHDQLRYWIIRQIHVSCGFMRGIETVQSMISIASSIDQFAVSAKLLQTLLAQTKQDPLNPANSALLTPNPELPERRALAKSHRQEADLRHGTSTAIVRAEFSTPMLTLQKSVHITVRISRWFHAGSKLSARCGHAVTKARMYQKADGVR